MSDNSVFEDYSVDLKAAIVSQCGCSDSEINSSPKEKPSETQHAFLQWFDHSEVWGEKYNKIFIVHSFVQGKLQTGCISFHLKRSVYGGLTFNYCSSNSIQKYLTNGYSEYQLIHIVRHLRKQKRQKFLRARTEMKIYYELIANQKPM